MKIVIKILNGLFVLLALIGLITIIYWGFNTDNIGKIGTLEEKIDSLDNVIYYKNNVISDLTVNYNFQKGETKMYSELYEKAKDNAAKIEVEHKEQLKVKDYTIEQLLGYITDYYNTDSTEVSIVQEGDSIMVLVTPRLITEIGNTIAEHQDNLELLEAYEIEITIADSLISSMTLQTDILESKVDFLEDVTKDLNSKVNILDEQVELSKEEVSKFKKQRNIVGVAGIVLVILVAL